MVGDYPPGVTGREPQIAGEDECPECGAPIYQGEEECVNPNCDAVFAVGPDPDDLYDRRRDGDY